MRSWDVLSPGEAGRSVVDGQGLGAVVQLRAGAVAAHRVIGLVEVGEVAQAVGGDMAEADEVVTLGVDAVVQEGQHGLPEGFDLGDGCEDGPAHQHESPLRPVFEDELHRNHPPHILHRLLFARVSICTQSVLRVGCFASFG